MEPVKVNRPKLSIQLFAWLRRSHFAFLLQSVQLAPNCREDVRKESRKYHNSDGL